MSDAFPADKVRMDLMGGEHLGRVTRCDKNVDRGKGKHGAAFI